MQTANTVKDIQHFAVCVRRHFLLAIGGSRSSCWEGPNLLFWVRGEARWAEARGQKDLIAGVGFWGWCSQPPFHQGLAERCKLPQRGLGRALAAKRFSCILQAPDTLLELVGGGEHGPP